MRKYFLWGFFCTLLAHAQDPSQAQLLDDEQIQKQFPTKIQRKLGITYPIVKVYTYQDREGKHFWVFTENKLYNTSSKKERNYKKNSEGEVINDKIKAFHLIEDKDAFRQVKLLYDYRPEWEG